MPHATHDTYEVVSGRRSQFGIGGYSSDIAALRSYAANLSLMPEQAQRGGDVLGRPTTMWSFPESWARLWMTGDWVVG